jgi:two-component system sensor histidine kinase/response regulator
MNHKNIQLITHYPPPPHRLVEVDASLFRRAIENLIANALKFSPADSEVVISVTYPETAGATVVIADRGPGVASQFREQIFEKYEIGPMLAGVSQMGLGLAFCKAIVEAHGGKIWVMDNPPRGSIFTLELLN